MDDCKKERKLYSEVCKDVAEFVGLPENALLNPDMVYNRLVLFKPLFSMYSPKEGEEKFRHKISCPTLIPFSLYKKKLKSEFRKAAHYEIFDQAYEEDPDRAHWLIRKQRPLYYETLLRYTLRPNKRSMIKAARALLEEYRAPEGLYREVEKLMYYRTITFGLRKSFSDENNFYRNIYYLIAGAGVATFIAGIVCTIIYDSAPDIIEIAQKGIKLSEEELMAQKIFFGGHLVTVASILGFPTAYYKKDQSLTPKNLERFTPSERRFLLAFPQEYTPLEERLEELKKHGFPV